MASDTKVPGDFADTTVLITGGAGSVGRAFIARLLDTDVDVVRILDSHEPSLAAMETEFGNGRLRYFVGDVRDKPRLERAMRDVDVVVHTAAMKHVDISEYNPFEAVKTNVVGLQNVVDTAIDSGAQRVIYTSSDKAVNPANTMGTTKLLGEKLVTAGNKYSGRADLRLGSVRFGNVIGSSGSVIPLFKNQIEDGGPVTLTHPEMSRFFITAAGMADLLQTAIRSTEGGEVFVRKMAAIRIEDLAEVMIEQLAPAYGHSPADIDIEVIGRRPGETTHEEIMTEREAGRALENDDLYVVPPDGGEKYLNRGDIEGFERSNSVIRSSSEAKFLETDRINSLLSECGELQH